MTAIERIIDRKVTAFASAIDADQGVVWEIFNLQPGDALSDGAGPWAPRAQP